MADKITPEMLDEARARAMLKEHLKGHEHWENVSANERAKWLRLARALREADAALGVVSVPKEATEEMMRAAWAGDTVNPADCINAAIRAGAIGGEDG